MFDFVQGILRKKAIKFAKANLKKIDSTQLSVCRGYYNHKCHWNSYTEFRIDPKAYDVIACITISVDEDFAMAHFINYDKENDCYFDTTLGTSVITDFVIYEIGVCDLSVEKCEDMNQRLGEVKGWIIDRCFTNKYVRKFFKKWHNRFNII